MNVKPVGRLYLMFEVDLDSMSVILIKDGKQVRTYDANQYFQYFVEYGVRKVDVEQLKEHFSIDFFQNMMVKGKGRDTFEFCVRFVGKDYKILECRMKVVENISGNIIRITLEDISHKRVQQLEYIKEHSLELENQPAAKPFDIKFEGLSKKQQKCINKIRCAVVIMLLVLSGLYAGYIYNIHIQTKANVQAGMLENCRNTSLMIGQRMEYFAKGISTLQDITATFGENVTQKEALEYLQGSKQEYGYEEVALVDENHNLVCSDNSLYAKLDSTEVVTNSADQEFVVLNLESENGIAYLNYTFFSKQLNIEGEKYLGIVALYDLSKICNIISLRGHCYDEQIVIADLDGKILLDNMRNHETDKEETNVFKGFSGNSDKILFQEKLNDMRENIASGKSGTCQSIWAGEKVFTAYMPLNVEGLYLFSFSSQNFIDARGGRFITLSILLWFLVLLLPCLMMVYIIKNSRKMRKDLEELAYRDHITKGMNVNYFNEVASSAIKAMDAPYALVLTNIINFNIYNEKFGHIKGDESIRQLFLGICRYIEEDEFICRTYADHMIILLKYHTEQRLEERLVEVSKCIMGTSFKLEFGVCVIRDATMELEVAKERAALALNGGKKRISEYAAWSFYELELVEKISFEKELENTMYKAFRRGEFKIYIEPRYELEKRAVCSGDAYVVWKHPDKGILEPELFMDIFERRALVICLDTYIFEEICKKIRTHMDEGRDVMPVCLKLHKSNVNITNSIDKFKRIKNRYEIPGKYLEFEITEEIFYEKVDSIGELIDGIHSMDCTCTMGNFGGGYLALKVLQEVEIDSIKLDKSWMELPMPQKMVGAMVEIGKAMGVKTIAEGITKEAQVRYLKKCGCDEGAGSVFSKTMTLEEYINIF